MTGLSLADDARYSMVMIFMTHNMVELDQFNQGIGFGVYGAITRFQALASVNNEFHDTAAS